MMAPRDLDICGEFAIRKGCVEKGGVVPGHTHAFGHLTIIISGRALLRVSKLRQVGTNDWDVIDEREVSGPDRVWIAAELLHEFTALDDLVYWCVYPHRDEGGQIVPDYRDLRWAYT